MGRGTGTRKVLQFTPLTDVATLEAGVLTLPIVGGGVLELSWDASISAMRVYGSLHTLLNTASIPRSDLPDWLFGMEEVVAARASTPFFGHFKFSYSDGDAAPRVYYGRGAEIFPLGTITSWSDLRAFLNTAHANNLF